jgi:hypothetical protein
LSKKQENICEELIDKNLGIDKDELNKQLTAEYNKFWSREDKKLSKEKIDEIKEELLRKFNNEKKKK